MDNSRFIVCRASAGSGKTYTLVRQYLELAFSVSEEDLPKGYGRILAITFTNKAVNEMKSRILDELALMSQPDKMSDMGRDLADRLGWDDATLQHRAAKLRSSILHNYSDFAVCTIDSFTHRIVRTFAHDLGLPMRFDLYTDYDELIQHAVDELMELVGTDGQTELTRVLCTFAESAMEENKSYLIERNLAELAKRLFDEDTPEYLKQLDQIDSTQFIEIRNEMAKANGQYEQRLRDIGSEALQAIADAGLEVNDFYQSTKGAGTYFQKLANGDMPTANSYVTSYLEGDKLSKKHTEEQAAVRPRLKELYEQVMQLNDSEGVRYQSRKMMMQNLFSLAVLNKLNELLTTYSHDNEIVHISEVNKQIFKIVQEEEAPFIYERIGNRYWYYLIDEFQDTSRMQWQNLVPLVENGVGGGHLSLVVGDGKQAIYRFRQGDVEQFIGLPQVDNKLHGRLLEHPDTCKHQWLKDNFRTAGNVVRFNNDLFDWIVRNRFSDNELLQRIYLGDDPTGEADLRQTPRKEGGYVQLGFWSLSDNKDILWEEILADIRDLVDNKHYRYRDILLLARANKQLEKASLYLSEHEVPVVSSESFLLTQSRVVLLLVNLLHYLYDHSNRVAAARALTYLESMELLPNDDGRDAFLEPTNTIDIDKILEANGIAFDSDQLLQLGLYDCLEAMLRTLPLDGIETAYTATLLNVTAQYATTHRQDLGEYLDWLDKNLCLDSPGDCKISTNIAGDTDAVRLMTIHKAKGLEAPIVICPLFRKRIATNEMWVELGEKEQMPLPVSLLKFSKNTPHSLFDDRFADERHKCDMDYVNMLYVALTRPKEKLLVYCEEPGKSEDSVTYPALLNDYLELSGVESYEVREGVKGIGDNSEKPEKKRREEEEQISERESHVIDTLAFPGWEGRIRIANQSDKVFGLADSEAIRRGNLIHELLSKIHNVDDADRCIDLLLPQLGADEKEQEEVRQTLHNMLSQEDIAPFFDPRYESKNECSLAWKKRILRPDRVVVTPDEVWVVDFKTGMPLIEHHDQVSGYCDAIQGIYPQRKVKGYLLYIGAERCQVCGV